MDDVYVKSLERRHAQQVYDNWPYKSSALPSEVADEISQLPSAGVFLKDTDELVAWIMCHPPNGLSRLHTMEKYRRRGYASLVTQYLCKRFAQAGMVPFVNIVVENVASQNVFLSMGFKFSCNSHVCAAQPIHH